MIEAWTLDKHRPNWEYLVEDLLERMRFEDLREMDTVCPCPSGGRLAHLCEAIIASDDVRMLYDADSVEPKPIALVGVNDMGDDQGGAAWLLAAEEVTQHRLGVLRYCRQLKDEWVARYPSGLWALADARNTLHLRWLNAVGGTRHHTGTTFNGIPFLLYSFR